jgi:hypothetical protein
VLTNDKNLIFKLKNLFFQNLSLIIAKSREKKQKKKKNKNNITSKKSLLNN